MMLAFGMVSALLAVKGGGSGQVIDCAMTDGSALLASLTWGLYAEGLWEDRTGVNRIDSGSPYYDTYETRDGKWVAIGAIEPQFYALLRDKLGLADDPDFDAQDDRSQWPRLKERLRNLLRTRTRDDWCAQLEGTDACFAPVLALAEAPDHPHNRARGTFIAVDGVTQPAPAPRYSGTQTETPTPLRMDADALLAALGYDPERIAALRHAKIIG